MNVMVLRHVSIVDVVNNRILQKRSVVCEDGRITGIYENDDFTVPNDAKELKLNGKFLLPGFIDADVHLSQPGIDDYKGTSFKNMTTRYTQSCDQTLACGVVTVREMPGAAYDSLKIKEKINSGSMTGPRMLVSSPALSAPFGCFSLRRYINAPPFIINILKQLFGINGVSIDIEHIGQVHEIVEKIKSKGFDFIKTVTPGTENDIISSDENKSPDNNNGIHPEILQSVTEYAHLNNIKVAAHNVSTVDGFDKAVDCGVDCIEHTPLGLIDEKTFDKMSGSDIYWVPAAFSYLNWKGFIDNPESYDSELIRKLVPEPYFSKGKKLISELSDKIKNADDNDFWKCLYNEIDKYEKEYLKKNLQNAIKHNVKIVAGTDAGVGGTGYVPHGMYYKELETLKEFGLSEYDVLKAATINGASLLGMHSDIGSIEKGKLADFVVITGNPIEDISCIKNISYVIKEGQIVLKDYC